MAVNKVSNNSPASAPDAIPGHITPELVNYAKAYLSANDELERLTAEEKRIAIRKAQLRETLKALGPLITPNTLDVSSLSLSDALRLVIASAGRALSTLEFKSRLQDLGYPLEKFENPMASIHTALSRMYEAGELTKNTPEGEKKTFGPGPELKPVPEVHPSGGSLEEALKGLEGQTEAGKKAK